MGLGKTLTTLTLIAGSLNEMARTSRKGKSTLIVTPLSTLTNWKGQILKHFKEGSLTFTTYYGPTRQKQLKQIESYDIVLTTYETLKADCPKAARGRRKVVEDEHSGGLHEFRWHRVVLDEAHVIRNKSSQAFGAVYSLEAKHRWCLTGTPIQNTIEDLGSLVSFLRVAPFDEAYTFRTYFMQSYATGETHKWKRLRMLVKAISLRRTKVSVGEELDLPPREERIESVILDDDEQAFYNLMKKRFASAMPHLQSSMNCFQLILRLRQICNHGLALLPEAERDWMLNAAIYAPEFAPLPLVCENCGATVLDENGSEVLPCFHQVCSTCLGRARSHSELTNNGQICPLCCSVAGDMDHEAVFATIRSREPSPTAVPESCNPSSKVKALLRNLTMDKRMAQDAGQHPPKSVVFSSWTRMLDLIGPALTKQGFSHQRLDGTKSLAQRERALKQFQSNPSCEVLLTTLGAGGVGLDLTAASRVHLMEPGWNPMLERQALDRIHRLGQTKDVVSRCYAVRGIDSIEEYMLQKQKDKLRLASSSFGGSTDRGDEHNSVVQDFGTIICR
ncbi:SNF2 family N-terminal domain-containing protein [Leptodontidium sp. 2 PMI_412]|nr:SNF2 family N-terminal domain-containing protein [Leptodontidium sp. 2 PMI_412]